MFDRVSFGGNMNINAHDEALEPTENLFTIHKRKGCLSSDQVLAEWLGLHKQFYTVTSLFSESN